MASSITTDLASECVNNAPYITYDITPFGFTPSGGATLTFYDLDGNLVDSTHVTDLTGRVLYPGAQVDAAGTRHRLARVEVRKRPVGRRSH